MASGVTLWVDARTTLFASRNPRDYDTEAGRVRHRRSTTAAAATADQRREGRGRGHHRRRRDRRSRRRADSEASKPGGTSPSTPRQDLKHSNPRLIDVKKAASFTMYKISLFNSPKFHVGSARGFVVWGVRWSRPRTRPTASAGRSTPHYARNTDGIDPSAASDGFIGYSYISVGDDQIAIKAGSGPDQQPGHRPQPLRHRPRHVDRQRDQRGGQPRERLSICHRRHHRLGQACPAATSTAFASSPIRAEAAR